MIILTSTSGNQELLHWSQWRFTSLRPVKVRGKLDPWPMFSAGVNQCNSLELNWAKLIYTIWKSVPQYVKNEVRYIPLVAAFHALPFLLLWFFTFYSHFWLFYCTSTFLKVSAEMTLVCHQKIWSGAANLHWFNVLFFPMFLKISRQK